MAANSNRKNADKKDLSLKAAAENGPVTGWKKREQKSIIELKFGQMTASNSDKSTKSLKKEEKNSTLSIDRKNHGVTITGDRKDLSVIKALRMYSFDLDEEEKD